MGGRQGAKLPVNLIVMVVSGLEELQVQLPQYPHPQAPCALLQELIDALLDVLGGHDGLHHDPGVTVFLSVVVVEVDPRKELHHLKVLGSGAGAEAGGSTWLGSLRPGHLLLLRTRKARHCTRRRWFLGILEMSLMKKENLDGDVGPLQCPVPEGV